MFPTAESIERVCGFRLPVLLGAVLPQPVVDGPFKVKVSVPA